MEEAAAAAAAKTDRVTIWVVPVPAWSCPSWIPRWVTTVAGMTVTTPPCDVTANEEGSICLGMMIFVMLVWPVDWSPGAEVVTTTVGCAGTTVGGGLSSAGGVGAGGAGEEAGTTIGVACWAGEAIGCWGGEEIGSSSTVSIVVCVPQGSEVRTREKRKIKSTPANVDTSLVHVILTQDKNDISLGDEDGYARGLQR